MSAARAARQRRRPGRGQASDRRRSGSGAPPDRSRASRTGLLAFLLGALLVVPPLVVVPGLRDPFRLPKDVLAEALALAAVAAATWSWWRSPQAPAWRRAGVALAPLGLAMLVSALASSHPEHALEASRRLAAALLLLVATAATLGQRRLRRLLDWTLWPAAILAGLAALEAAGWFEALATVESGRHGLVSLAGNVGDLGAYLVLPALLAQARVVSRVRAGALDRGAVGWLLLAIGLSLPILLGQVLTAAIALGAATVVLWALALGRRGVSWVALVVVLLAGIAAATPVRQRVAEELRAWSSGGWNEVLTGRLDGWRAGVQIGVEHPLLGAGPGAYRAEFARAKLDLTARGVPFYGGHGSRATFANAHNEPIELFAELGVAGLLAVAWLAWRLASRCRALHGAERAFAVAALVAFTGLSLAYFPARVALVAYPWVLVAAWLLAETEPLGTEARGRRKPVFAVLAAVALVVAFADVRHGLARMRANRTLFVAETEASYGTTPALRERLRDRRRALVRAFAAEPWDARFPLAIGSHHLLLGESARAVEWYRRSLALEPRPETFLNLGRALWAAGRREEGLEQFANAVALTPALRRQLPAEARPLVPTERGHQRRRERGSL